jgi:hypothetical protein
MVGSHQIVIGGLGGSGTRAVAMAVEKLGYHCGPWLIGAHDSTLFACLLKSPALLAGRDRDKQVARRLQLFVQIMRRGLTSGDVLRQPKLARFWRQIGSPGLEGQPDALGWLAKEPNSHLFVEDMTQLYPELRYIHVTRHPLDMAFSKNKKQLQLWGKMFGVDPDKAKSLESAQLDYWIKIQQNVSAIQGHKPGQCIILDFDEFCRNPRSVLVRTLNQLNLPYVSDSIPAAVDHVVVPASHGRWQFRNLGVFSDEQLAACRVLGWEITGSRSHDRPGDDDRK